MIDNPLVNARLKWMIDPGFVMTTCYTIVSRDGAAGQPLHGGWFYGAGPNYHFRDGQPRTEQVNIGWLLQDVETATGDGGLMLVPRKPQSAATAAAPEANQLRPAAGQAYAGRCRDGDHVPGHDDARRAQLAQPQSRAALRQHQSGTQYTAGRSARRRNRAPDDLWHFVVVPAEG